MFKSIYGRKSFHQPRYSRLLCLRCNFPFRWTRRADAQPAVQQHRDTHSVVQQQHWDEAHPVVPIRLQSKGDNDQQGDQVFWIHHKMLLPDEGNGFSLLSRQNLVLCLLTWQENVCCVSGLTWQDQQHFWWRDSPSASSLCSAVFFLVGEWRLFIQNQPQNFTVSFWTGKFAPIQSKYTYSEFAPI